MPCYTASGHVHLESTSSPPRVHLGKSTFKRSRKPDAGIGPLGVSGVRIRQSYPAAFRSAKAILDSLIMFPHVLSAEVDTAPTSSLGITRPKWTGQ
jgi:hypothetical protein